MNLQALFQENPPEEIVKEFPLGSGIRYIPVKEIKRLLHEKFDRWGTSNLRVQYVQHGHNFWISGSVELNLELHLDRVEKFTFVGANSFKTGTEQAEGNNDNYEAILLANCLKNASKNCGNLFGQNLNQVEDYLPNYNDVQAPKKTSLKKDINKIANQLNKK